MATSVAPNNTYTAYTKPTPGEAVVTQTTVTQTTQGAVAEYPVKQNIFASIFGILAAVAMFLGAVLILAAAALILRDSSYHYTSIGGLLIAGFSLWFIAAVLNNVSPLGYFNKGARNQAGYHIFNFIASVLAWVAFALFIAGAACWLSQYGNPRYAGEILWVIAGSLWLVSLLVRDMGVRYDAMNTYKNYPVLPNTVNDTQYKKNLGAHISSIWGNALATDLYLISSVLFLLGAIMFVARGRNYGINDYTARQFEIAAGCMWIVGAGIVLFASLAHCVARR
jgi:hypothetical protein